LLQEGNRRFISGKTLRPHGDPARRADVASGQEPFAIIVGCADSRTSPELLFDRGLGDLFVTREAGNVVGDHAIGSIEYAVAHLHSRLIVVLGHERCGAVKAAREVVASKGHAEGHVHSLVEAIKPAVDATSGMDAEATCRENVRNVARQLRESDPILKGMVDRKEIQVVGAHYDLDTGFVMFMPE
jgi:carbonic anhydrase